jgi:hypothetical protein
MVRLAGLGSLVVAVRMAGFGVIGPTIREGAIVLAELDSADALPYGWGVTLSPGGYRLRQRDDAAAFGHAAGPQSWKTYLHPPRTAVWTARRGDSASEWTVTEDEPRRYAFSVCARAICGRSACRTGCWARAHPDRGYAPQANAWIIRCTASGRPASASRPAPATPPRASIWP